MVEASPHGCADDLAAIEQKGSITKIGSWFLVMTDETRFCTTDTGLIEYHAQVGSCPKTPGMRITMGVKEKNIRYNG